MCAKPSKTLFSLGDGRDLLRIFCILVRIKVSLCDGKPMSSTTSTYASIVRFISEWSAMILSTSS